MIHLHMFGLIVVYEIVSNVYEQFVLTKELHG